jgi:hypothetical protein
MVLRRLLDVREIRDRFVRHGDPSEVSVPLQLAVKPLLDSPGRYLVGHRKELVEIEMLGRIENLDANDGPLVPLAECFFALHHSGSPLLRHPSSS